MTRLSIPAPPHLPARKTQERAFDTVGARSFKDSEVHRPAEGQRCEFGYSTSPSVAGVFMPFDSRPR